MSDIEKVILCPDFGRFGNPDEVGDTRVIGTPLKREFRRGLDDWRRCRFEEDRRCV